MALADLTTVAGDAAKALLEESKFPKTAEYSLGKDAPVKVVRSEHTQRGLHWDIWLNNARMHGLVRRGQPLLAEAP